MHMLEVLGLCNTILMTYSSDGSRFCNHVNSGARHEDACGRFHGSLSNLENASYILVNGRHVFFLFLFTDLIAWKLLSIDYTQDCKALVGTYIEAHIDAGITNENEDYRQSCLYLGPSGNIKRSILWVVNDTGLVVARRILCVLQSPDAISDKVE